MSAYKLFFVIKIQVVGPIQTSLSEKRLRLNSLRTGLVYHFSVSLVAVLIYNCTVMIIGEG